MVITKFMCIFAPMKNYFTVEELTASDVARKFNIDNTPTPQVRQHLEELIDKLLNPIRDAWGSPVIVSSGYRCPALNTRVGGAKKSAHLTGYAADLVPSNGRRKEFINFVQKFLLSSGLYFDQCINEYGRWCHVGLKNLEGRQRKQIFKIS